MLKALRHRVAHMKGYLTQLKEDIKNLDAPYVHEHEFLPAALEIQQRPSPAIARALAYTICAFFVVTLLWAILGTVDIIAVAQGQIAPNGGVKIIQPLETSVVQKIDVQNGQQVKAGDVLVELDASAVGADQQGQSYDLASTTLSLMRLQALLQNKPFNPPSTYASDMAALQQNAYTSAKEAYDASVASKQGVVDQRQADYAASAQEIKRLAKTLPLVTKRATIVKQLAADGYSSKLSALSVEEERVKTASDLISQKEHLREAAGALKEAQKDLANTKAQWRNDLLNQMNDLEQKKISYAKDLEKTTRRQSLYRLSSPIDGTVQELAIHTVGGVVTPAQELMKVVPHDATLEAEVDVKNRDIGFVRQGQDVEVKIDAFPFTKYGYIKGKLTSLSMDAKQLKDGSFVFPGRVKLSKTILDINGKHVPLKPGMTVTAEVKTGTRHIIEYFLSPVMATTSEAIHER